MTTGNETDPRDDALAKAWRAQSQDMPPPALDATILAAAHRAVGSGPLDAGKQALEATRPQRWWMPLAAAATIGVVVIGILQIAPQAPVDIVVGERADVAGRVAPVILAAPAKDAALGNVVGQAQEAAPAKNVEQGGTVAPTTVAPSTAAPTAVAREKKAVPEVAPASSPPAATAAIIDARKQVAAAPSMPALEPFPADKLSANVDAPSTTRQNKRKDAVEAQRAPAPFNEGAARSEVKSPSSAQNAVPASAAMAPPSPAASPAPMAAPAPAPMLAQVPAPPAARAAAPSMLAPVPMKKESMERASGSLATADSAAKPAPAAREHDAARDEMSARNAPSAASPELARSTASPAELQARARDPDAWIARIRKLRADGRVTEAVAELREFRRYVPDAETRLPTDLRQWVPNP